MSASERPPSPNRPGTTMANDREAVLARVRAALAPLKEKTPYPQYDPAISVSRPWRTYGSLAEQFCHRLEQTNGIALRGWAALGHFLEERTVGKGYGEAALVSMLQPFNLRIHWSSTFKRAHLDEYEVAVTKAWGAVAETGSIILRDADLPYRLAAVAPWIHIAVVDEKNIFPDLATAIQNMDGDPSIIIVTGPSKTADVEGILIEGVHGPGVQACCLI